MAVRLFLKKLPCEPGKFFLEERGSLDHLRALRVRLGEAVFLLDGQGALAHCSLIEAGKNQATLNVLSLERAQRPARTISLACALLQGKAFETVVRHCAEMGAQAIYPLITERTQAPSKLKFPMERLSSLAMEACKQSGNPFLPQIHGPQKLESFLQGIHEGVKLVASLEEGAQPTASWLTPGNTAAHLLIGPEGDFSPAEYALIAQRQWKRARLAPYVLRTEVAALAMLAQVVSGA